MRWHSLFCPHKESVIQELFEDEAAMAAFEPFLEVTMERQEELLRKFSRSNGLWSAVWIVCTTLDCEPVLIGNRRRCAKWHIWGFSSWRHGGAGGGGRGMQLKHSTVVGRGVRLQQCTYSGR